MDPEETGSADEVNSIDVPPDMHAAPPMMEIEMPYDPDIESPAERTPPMIQTRIETRYGPCFTISHEEKSPAAISREETGRIDRGVDPKGPTNSATVGENAQDRKTSAVVNMDKRVEATTSMRIATGENLDTAPPIGGVVVKSVVGISSRRGDKKLLLSPMTIDFPEGSVTAILGPNGKNTLLNFVAGSMPQSSRNSIFAEGQVNLPGSMACVPKDDRLHGFFSCRAYMKHYARLSGQQINPETETMIDSLLNGLGLYQQKDVVVGDPLYASRGLTAGQKKRLSIGLEAVSGPENLLLEEPFNNIDSDSAFCTMRFLKNYAAERPGRRVIVTVERPSSLIWELIDNVIILWKGNLIYQGPRNKVESFFEQAGFPSPLNYNPADHYVKILNDKQFSVKKWADAFHEWRLIHKTLEEISLEDFPKETKASQPTLQVAELIRRSFVTLWRNPGVLGIRVILFLALSLFIGLLFWNMTSLPDENILPRSALLFYLNSIFPFASFVVLPFTKVEDEIADKEVLNKKYRAEYYHMAQALVSVPAALLLALIVTFIVVPMVGLGDPLWFFLAMFLNLLCAEALVQFVSRTVSLHYMVGIIILLATYSVFIPLQGFMLVSSDFPAWLRWMHNIPFLTYSWRTLMYSEFHDDNEFGDSVLHAFDLSDVDRVKDVFVLIAYTLIVHILSTLVLNRKYSSVRNGQVVTSNGSSATWVGGENVERKETSSDRETESSSPHHSTADSAEYALPHSMYPPSIRGSNLAPLYSNYSVSHSVAESADFTSPHLFYESSVGGSKRSLPSIYSNWEHY